MFWYSFSLCGYDSVSRESQLVFLLCNLLVLFVFTPRRGKMRGKKLEQQHYKNLQISKRKLILTPKHAHASRQLQQNNTILSGYDYKRQNTTVTV